MPDGVVKAENLCGDDGPLWNRSLVWDTRRPVLSPCFSLTVFLVTSCVSVFVFLFAIGFVTRQREPSLVRTGLTITKWTFFAFALAAGVVFAVFAIALDEGDGVVQIVSSIAFLVAVSLATTNFHCHRRHGVVTSASQTFFWFSSSLSSLLTAVVLIRDAVDLSRGLARSSSFAAVSFLVVVNFFLHCFAEKSVTVDAVDPRSDADLSSPRPLCPEAAASSVSILTFHWTASLMVRGFKGPLVPEDVWALRQQHGAKNTSERFWISWRKRARLKKETKKVHGFVSSERPPENKSAAPADSVRETGQFEFAIPIVDDEWALSSRH